MTTQAVSGSNSSTGSRARSSGSSKTLAGCDTDPPSALQSPSERATSVSELCDWSSPAARSRTPVASPPRCRKRRGSRSGPPIGLDGARPVPPIPPMTNRIDFVAMICALFVGGATLVGCSSTHASPEDLSQGVSPSASAPKSRLIVLGRSIGGISLNESRKSVEKALGHGMSRRRGVVWYFGGRLRVDYRFHDRLTKRVEGLQTTFPGFRTRSGVRVGTSRGALRAVHVTCRDRKCWRLAGRMPDAPATVFTLRGGKVARIEIFYA